MFTVASTKRQLRNTPLAHMAVSGSKKRASPCIGAKGIRGTAAGSLPTFAARTALP